jgi:predicted nuclease of predicted toxin-antitoxin system
MKFKLDENLSPTLSDLFSAAGHEAHSVVAQRLGGKPDAQVADVCRQENRALISFDLDFANIRTYPPSQFSGLVVLRLSNQSHPAAEPAIRRMLAIMPDTRLAGWLWIVEDHQIRIREAP